MARSDRYTFTQSRAEVRPALRIVTANAAQLFASPMSSPVENDRLWKLEHLDQDEAVFRSCLTHSPAAIPGVARPRTPRHCDASGAAA
jgi:hypothetical protein